MEHLDLVKASHEGDINLLYSAIQKDPTILDQIDTIPFVDTPLHVAASCGHVEFAMEVARLKPSFTRKPNLEGLTPMHVALDKDQHEMVSWLLASDSELARVKGREGATPLHFAVRRGQVDVVEMLLSSCFRSIEDLTNRNESAFHVALKSGQLPAFNLLLERLHVEGVEAGELLLDAKDLEGNTVLHVAAAMNQVQAIESLLKWFGMLSMNATNQNGQTALETAVAYHHSSVESLLTRAALKQNSIANATIHQPAPAPASTEDETVLPLTRDEIIDWEDYFVFQFGKTDPEKTRSNLLVVAVLMATATYTAVLTPPGGVDDKTGLSRLAERLPFSYIWFMVCNSAGFFVSMNTIMLLIYKYPMYWEIYMAMFAMVATYDVAMVSINPRGWMKDIFTGISIGMPIGIPMGYHWFRKWCLCRGRRRRRKLSRSPTAYARV